MLVLERLVYAYVVVSPAVVRCCRRLYTGTGAACYGIHRHVALEQMLLGKRQQAKFNTGRKAARIGYITALAGVAAVKLGQTVYEIVLMALYAIVHREVYHLQFIG